MTSIDTSESLPISSNDVGHHTEGSDPQIPILGHHTEDLDPQIPILGHHTEDSDPQIPIHGDADKKGEISEEEVNGVLEVIAATGKFWHDWDTLKSLLSFRLKQVLAEYPEAQMVADEQNSLLGETYAELVTRLDEALLCFVEGPPFTLQRLCEILLNARSIYPNLSKLALALEKNLLVTSTLIISTDPYPSAMISKRDELDKEPAGLVAHSSPVQNGINSAVCDEDIEMANAEDVHEEVKNRESETAKEISSKASETGTEQGTIPDPPVESSPSSEQQN